MRTNKHLLCVLSAWLVLALSCSTKDAQLTNEGSERAQAATSAAEGAMCSEHGVLEAVCTKCNPKLIPVFQAKGDWCAEHGFPESFCPICHPERGGKPAADVSPDGAPAHGTRIRFKKKDTAQLAGIETAKAVARPSAVAVTAPARIAYDATKLAHINARASGVVRGLKVEVGMKVTKGQTLLTIESPEVGAGQARLMAARSRLQTAQDNLTRQQVMQAEGIAAKKNVLAAQQEADAAKAEIAALTASLSLVSTPQQAAGTYSVVAPITGTVTARNVTIGKLVSEGEMLLEVVDTRSMWAEVEIAEGDLQRVAAGDDVSLRIEGLGDRELTGQIAYIAPAVDPHTRTTIARVALTNDDGALRANMFGQARIAARGGSPVVAVPRSAVQRARDTQLVFVKLAEDEYETRRVQTGGSDPEFVEILKGVEPNEEVVTTGAFLLKTETLKDSIGAGCCDGE